MKILITGAVGFIGYHLSKRLLDEENEVIGIDNMNSYYDQRLKKSRLDILEEYDKFKFYKIDISNKTMVDNVFEDVRPSYVINLAAQAGVRYSIDNPYAYIDSNVIGFMNILEACRNFPIKHLLYASSSSVYGGNKKVPFSTNDNVDHPVSLYAATKKANELMAHTYSHLYSLPTSGLRFFTVYGPYGRPDMAYYSFTKDIIEGKSIKIYNGGDMERDFTYIDDIVEGIINLINKIPVANENWNETFCELSTSFAPYKIYNIGNSNPVRLEEFINVLEVAIGKRANRIYLDMQPGDVVTTFADVSDLEKTINFKPSTSIKEGLVKFVDWYRDYYGVED